MSVAREVKAAIDRCGVPHPHFVLSPLPPGGYSRGPVNSEGGSLLAAVTETLSAQFELAQSNIADRREVAFGLVRRGLHPRRIVALPSE